MMFELQYTRHGGSGLSFGYAEVQEMAVSDILEWTRMLDDRLTQEAKQIRAAQRKR